MPDDAPRRVAQAIRSHAHGVARYVTQPHDYARIVSLDPLVAENTTTGERMEEGNDIQLGWTVRKYDHDMGLEVNDTLVLVQMGDGDFVAYEVLSDKDPPD